MTDVTRSAKALATAAQPARRVIVKLNDASWGDAIGNAVVDCAKLRLSGDLSPSVEVMLQPWDDFAGEIAAGGAIVEEYLDDVVCSPSGQGYIHHDGSTTVSSTHEQITVDGQYLGCSFPGHLDFAPRVRAAVAEVGRTLQGYGVRGTFGVDFVGLANNDLLATEINVRKVGPSHAWAYARSVRGAELSHYVHRRFYEPSILIYLDPHSAVMALKERRLLYDRDTGQGALLHILGAVRTCGYVEMTCLADRPGDAERLDRRVQDALREAATGKEAVEGIHARSVTTSHSRPDQPLRVANLGL